MSDDMDFSHMRDDELVRALTFHEDQYSARELQRATRELLHRKREVTAFLDRVQASLNDGEPERCTRATALAKLKNEIARGNVWRFVNCAGDRIDLQKEASFWTIHLFEQEEYQRSCLIASTDDVENFLSQFLRLNADECAGDYAYRLEECETLINSSSAGVIEKTSLALTRAEIPHTVRHDELAALTILIPPEYQEAAADVVTQIDNAAQALREEIETLVHRNERDPRLLDLYSRLAQLVADDPAVSYGRGLLLFEAGRKEEAAEAFIETLEAPQSDLPEDDYQAYRAEAEEHLVRLAQTLPRNANILHALAGKAMSEQNNAGALKHFEAILAISPTDSVAHVNLGVLYAQEPQGDARAAEHFKTYLEQQPNAEDRPAIEEMLAQLQA